MIFIIYLDVYKLSTKMQYPYPLPIIKPESGQKHSALQHDGAGKTDLITTTLPG